MNERDSEPTGGSVEAAAILAELTEVVTAAAVRLHAHHRLRATVWTTAAYLIGVAVPLLSPRRPAPVAACAAGAVGALARAGRHRALAALARPE